MRPYVQIALIVLTLPGCAGIAGDEYLGEPLLAIHGSVTNESARRIDGKLRVALVWTHPRKTEVMIAQEAKLRPEFPSSFRLSVFDLPPAEVLDSESLSFFPGEQSLTFGTVVAYLDGNDNRRLDLLPWHAEQADDSVVGVAEQFDLLYLEGDPMIIPETPYGDEYVILDEGFTLQRTPGGLVHLRCETLKRTCWRNADDSFCDDLFSACVQADPPPELENQGTIPLHTEIRLPLTFEERLAQWICIENPGEYVAGFFVLTDPDTWPAGAVRSCSDDGLTISFGFDAPVSLCQATSIPGDGNFPWPLGIGVPDWWPCEQVRQ